MHDIQQVFLESNAILLSDFREKKRSREREKNNEIRYVYKAYVFEMLTNVVFLREEEEEEEEKVCILFDLLLEIRNSLWTIKIL